METHTCVYRYGFCMGTGPGFVFKYIYTYNNIEIYYIVPKRINNTIENEHTSLFSRVEGVVVVGCSRELPTTLENEHKYLVFKDGVVVVVPRSDHP